MSLNARTRKGDIKLEEKSKMTRKKGAISWSRSCDSIAENLSGLKFLLEGDREQCARKDWGCSLLSPSNIWCKSYYHIIGFWWLWRVKTCEVCWFLWQVGCSSQGIIALSWNTNLTRCFGTIHILVKSYGINLRISLEMNKALTTI